MDYTSVDESAKEALMAVATKEEAVDLLVCAWKEIRELRDWKRSTLKVLDEQDSARDRLYGSLPVEY